MSPKFGLASLVLQLTWILIKYAHGECGPNAVNKCRDAAQQGDLQQLQQGGSCEEKSYHSYTHICEVTHYDPGAERYCCCKSARRTLCCNYFMNFNNFRCRDSTDVVGVDSPITLELTLGLIAAAALIVLVIVCTCCCCKNRKSLKALGDEDDMEGKQNSQADAYAAVHRAADMSLQPCCGNCHQDGLQHPASSSRQCTACTQTFIRRLQPSAPPLEDEIPFLGEHYIVPSNPSSVTLTIPPNAGYTDVIVSVSSVPPSDNQPPPPYEEVVRTEMSQT